MKTISILLLAVLSLTACALDEAPRSGVPGRPAHKPALSDAVVTGDVGITEVETDIDEVDSGDWAEDVVINGVPRTVLHHVDGHDELLD